MTTLRDILTDLLAGAEERMMTFVEKDQEPHLTDEDKEALIEEALETITERIVG